MTDHSKTPVRIDLRRNERDLLTDANWRRLGLDATAFPIISPALRAETQQPIRFLGEQYADAIEELHQLALAIHATLERFDQPAARAERRNIVGDRLSLEEAANEPAVLWASQASAAVDAIAVRAFDCAVMLGLAERREGGAS